MAKGIITDKEEMLKLIRNDRPSQVINEVKEFRWNDLLNFYEVKVDMESEFFGTKILHTHTTLPYPIKRYLKLSEHDQFEWRFETA